MAVKRGDVLDLDEKDYRYGVGPLRLRVGKFIAATQMGDGWWVTVRGVEVRWDGKDGDRRDVAVPADLLGLRPEDVPVAVAVHTGSIHPTTRS